MSTIFFIGSFIALFVMIVAKSFQIRTGNVNFISNLFKKADVLVDGLIAGYFLRFNYFKKVANLFLFDFIPSLAYEMLVKSKDYVSRRYYNAGNEFRGRRMLRSDGSVSSFLERLSEDAK